MTKLYIKDNKGSMREWSIGQDEQDIVIRFGQVGGAIQEKREHVPYGKVNRTIEEQIELQISSRISRQRDKGYVDSIEEAKKGPTNQLGLRKPMLAQRLDRVIVNLNDVLIQKKYDGNRCCITRQNGMIVPYSRNGKIIAADLSHITRHLKLDEGQTIDGELYCHGEKLQTIVSWIKRDQPDTKRLKFHAYDLMDDRHYDARMYDLIDILGTQTNSEFVPTVRASGMEQIMRYHRNAIADGYEGTIIRLPGFGYEAGKRSRSLLKLKTFLDSEFEVVDIHESKDGWAILECEIPDGGTFRVTAPGTMEDKIEVFYNAEFYIGETVHVEFAYYTKDGKPFHPVATAFRNPATE
jgi:DNA ligase 1